MSGPLQSAVKAGRSLTKAEKLAEQGFHLKMVNSFLRKNPSLSRFRDDLESAANFGLAEADKSFQSGNFEALATTVIRRRMIKEIRGLLGESEQSPRRAVSLNARTPAGGEIVDLMPTRSPSPLRTLLAKEDLSRLEQAMGKLPARERGLVEMDLLGNSVAEMADSLGIKARSVSTMLSTAKAKLRKELSATVLAPLFMEEEAQAQPSRFRPGPLEGQQGGQQPSRFQPGPLADEPEGFLGTSMQSLSKVPGDLLKVLTGDSDAPPVPGDTLMRLGGTMPRVEGALAALGHASDPIFNALGNVGRTFMASAPPSYGPGVAGDLAPQDTPEEQEAKRLLFQQNISRIGNVSEESDRPTTGSASGDLIADVAASLIPIGKAVNLGRRVAGLGKARMVEEAVKETPDLARQVSRAVDEAEDIEKARRGAAAAQDAAMKADPAAVEAARQGQLKARVEGLGLVGEDEMDLLSMAKPADAKKISLRLLEEEVKDAGIPEEFMDTVYRSLLRGKPRSEQDVRQVRTFIKRYREDEKDASRLLERFDVRNIENLWEGSKLRYKAKPLGERGLSAGITSAGVRLSKQGPAGKEAWRLAEEGLKYSNRRLGHAVDRLQQLTGRPVEGFGFRKVKGAKPMSDAEVTSLWETLEGGIPINQRVQKAADEIDGINRIIAEEAAIFGVQVRRLDGSMHLFSPLKNYYPQFPNLQLLQRPSGMKRAIRHMVSKGLDPEDAERKILYMLGGQRTGKFGNLEMAREVNLPPFLRSTDPLSDLPLYWERAFERLEMARVFGADSQQAVERVTRAVRATGYDAAFVETFMRHLLKVRETDEVADLWSRGIRSAQIFMKFTTPTGLVNLSQHGATALRTSVTDTFKALLQNASKRDQARRAALRGGAIKPRFNLFMNEAGDRDTIAVFEQVTGDVAAGLTDQVMAIKSPMRQFGEKLVGGLERAAEFNMRRVSFMEQTESHLRPVAFNAGVLYTKRQVRRMLDPGSIPGMRYLPKRLRQRLSANFMRRAEVELKELGLDPDEIRALGGASDEMMQMAGQRVVDASQFGAGFHQMPMIAASPLGKVLTQFRTFTINNTRLLKDEFIRRPTHTMAVIAALGIPVSTGTMYVTGRGSFSLRDTKKFFSENPEVEAVVDSLTSIMVNNIFLDVYKSFQYGPSGAAGAIAGPTASDAAKVLTRDPRSSVPSVLIPNQAKLLLRAAGVEVGGRKKKKEGLGN